MPHSNPVNWQPISEMPLIASMIDGALDDTRIHLETLIQARTRPHVLDDATIDRSKQVHTEQLEFVDIYARQISRWRTARPSADHTRELNRMDGQNQQLRTVTEAVLALADELRKGSIDRIMGMSDIELGLQALLGRGSASPR
jgi:hypothetical protein